MDGISGPEQSDEIERHHSDAAPNEVPEATTVAATDTEIRPVGSSASEGTFSSRVAWRWAGIVFIVFGLALSAFFVTRHLLSDKLASTQTSDATQRFGTVSLPLAQTVSRLGSASAQAGTLTVNGGLNINGSLVLKPSARPTSATAGQLYFDSATNLLSYYDGSRFVSLPGGGNTLVTNNSVTNVAGVTNVTNTGGGGVAGVNGVAGAIAMFTNPTTLGSSLITQNGTSLTTGNGVENVTLGSLAGTSAAALQGGTGGLNLITGDTVGSSGSINISSGASSTTSSGNVTVDTGNGIVSGTQIEDYSYENGNENFFGFIGSFTVTQDCTIAHTGSCSLNVTGDDPSGGGNDVYVEQGTNPAFPVVAGHHYFLQTFAKAAGASSTISNSIEFEPGNVFCNANDATDNSTSWTQYAWSCVAPAGVTTAIFVFGFHAGSLETHYFDDATVIDTSASNSQSSLLLGAANAQLVTIGNLNEIQPTSIIGGSGINVNSGLGAFNLTGGSYSLTSSAASSLSTTSGALNITAGGSSTWQIGSSGGAGGDLAIAAGDAGGLNSGGNLLLQAGSATGTGAGGNLTISGGAAAGNNIIGSNMVVNASNGTGVGGSGNINFYTAGGLNDPQVTFDSTAGSEQSITNATMNWTHTTGNESDMVMLVTVDSALTNEVPSSATAVTYDGLVMNRLVNLVDPSGGFSEANGSVWYLVNPPSGSHTVSVSLSGNPSDVGAESTTFYNVDTTNPIANFADNQAAEASSASTTLTPTNAGEGIFDAFMTRASIDDASVAPLAGQTSLYGQAFFGDSNFGSFRQGDATLTTAGYTASGSADVNNVAIALAPEPNVTPDSLAQTLSITQSGSLGIDLGASETAGSTISFGGSADRSISVNQNPGAGVGHNLTLAAGSGGAAGDNDGGNLVLQSGAGTGAGTGGSVIVKPQTDSAAAFEVQNSTGVALLTANTSTMTISVKALVITTNLTVDGHIITGGATPSIAAGPAACTSPTVSITGTDTTGTVTVTTGTGCSTGGALATITFAGAYASAPRVLLTPGSSVAQTLGAYIDDSTVSTTAFALGTNATPSGGTTFEWNYWVAQ